MGKNDMNFSALNFLSYHYTAERETRTLTSLRKWVLKTHVSANSTISASDYPYRQIYTAVIKLASDIQPREGSQFIIS